MYTPRYSLEGRPEVLRDFMRQHSFALLVSNGTEGLMATHLPVVVREGVLQMHVARPNPQWREFGPEGKALVVFSRPHAYISPAWYSDSATVPTWNYAAVHVSGSVRVFEGEELRTHLEELVAVNESLYGQGWTLSRTPEKYLNGLQQGIVGIEVRIEKVEGKAKMSQNRDDADRRGAIAGLRQTGRPADAAVADWMERLPG